MTEQVVRIWYVSSQRLCNFRCAYCVSINDYAKSSSEDWLTDDERSRFERIVKWIGSRPFRVGVRLATLGEPFASRAFLTQAAWLSTRPNVQFVELLTNGSLLKRLEQLASEGDIGKFALWITHHHTEITVQQLIDNALYARDNYGCFVVVNGLLFPDNRAHIVELREAAERAGLRFNLDLGYDPLTPHGAHTKLGDMIPVLEQSDDWFERAIDLGAKPDLISLNLSALRDLRERNCRAGYDYFYVGIRGDVYRCSRYQALGKECLGNVLDDDFELHLSKTRWMPCKANFGCGNKEDFLNLEQSHELDRSSPSLGWIGS